MQLELYQKQMELVVEQRMGALKEDKDAETKILIAELNANSAERIAMLQATIDARLEALKVANEDVQHRREQRTAMSIADTTAETTSTAVDSKLGARLDKVAGALEEHVKTMKRPRKVKRNSDGDVVGTELG
jgi:hypothetical protein